MSQLAVGMTLGGRRLTKSLRSVSGRQVFLAVEIGNESRRTVVKTAPLGQQSDVARLAREFQALRDAGGPGVAVATEHFVSLAQGLACLSLIEFGPSLAIIQAAAPGGKLMAEIALAAAHGAAAALAQLHDRGWRHGDLKPGNLLCNAAGDIVLTDLEFAAALDDSTVSDFPEMHVTGTPPFIAPELWQHGQSGATAAADVWALGVTLHLLLTGEYPFGRDEPPSIAGAILSGPPAQLAALPEALQMLLSRLLCVDRFSRPRDGGEAAQLIAIAADLLGCSLEGGKQALGLLAAAAGDGELPAEPATLAAPSPSSASPAPGATYYPPTPLVPPPAPPHPPEMPRRRPPGAGAAAPLPQFSRPEGIGAGDSPAGSLWRKSQHLDVSSRAIDLRPRSGAASRTSSATPVPHLPLPSLAPFPVAPPAPVVAAPQLKRKAAARWYRRMNPDRNFPLSVVFSGKTIRIVGGSGLGITLGEREIELDPDDPVLRVEPWFPGCLISPPRADVHVSSETTVCRFWVTPLVCGDLSEACVTVRYRGKVVETLKTPAEVVTRTMAKVLAGLSIVSPVVSKSLDLAGWNLDDSLRRWLPYAADALIGMGPLRSGLLLGGVLLTGAAFHLYVTRPLTSEETEPSLLPQAG